MMTADVAIIANEPAPAHVHRLVAAFLLFHDGFDAFRLRPRRASGPSAGEFLRESFPVTR
jgi:hypothetical protein